MREIEDMLAKAVKELDNEKVKFETYCANGDNDISQELRLIINGVVVSLYTDADNEYICGATVVRCL